MMRHTIPFERIVRFGSPAWRHTCGRVVFRDLLSEEPVPLADEPQWPCPCEHGNQGEWKPVFMYVGDPCDQCQGNGWVRIAGKVHGAPSGYEAVTECTACAGSGLPHPLGPADYPVQLREAVLEAEELAESKTSPEPRFTDGYATGLRVAAGMFGLPEGQDPATRRRMAAGELPDPASA